MYINSCAGINLAGVVDWSPEWPFVDLFKSSRAWISQGFFNSPWSTGTPQDLRPDGYPASLSPNQKLGAMMMRDLHGHMRSGTFVCLYDGDGILQFSMDVYAVKRSVGRIELTIRPSTGLNNGAFVMIERTNPLDPIRNIRFVMPGFENTHVAFPFHPLFLDSLKNYKTLRFMDWMNTNNVVNGSWAARTTNETASSYSIAATVSGNSPGVAIEAMILLCNTLGTNAWFNMPHLADDEYLHNFATLVRVKLRPDVTIYIEYR
jgi:hypothetical protein